MMNLSSLEEISKEFPNQEITEAKLDELEAVKDFQSVENGGKFRISCKSIHWKKGD